MTLVLLSLLPLLAGAGFAISVVISRLSATMNRAYAGERAPPPPRPARMQRGANRSSDAHS
jgi:hypothetical protein